VRRRCGVATDGFSDSGQLHAQTAYNTSTPKANKHNSYSCASAFRLATLGGAECVNMADRIGTVEPGKLADIVLYDALSPNLAGVSDPFRGIAIHATGQDVEWVFVNGKVVKKAGALVPITTSVGLEDWPAVARRLRERQAVVRGKLAQYDLEERYVHVANSLGATFAQ
jgi:cytosine/adenosine deaminase-related metal-dependent hydrolase